MGQTLEPPNDTDVEAPATQVACKKLKVGKGPHYTQCALRFGKTNKQPPTSSGAGTSTADAIQAW